MTTHTRLAGINEQQCSPTRHPRASEGLSPKAVIPSMLNTGMNITTRDNLVTKGQTIDCLTRHQRKGDSTSRSGTNTTQMTTPLTQLRGYKQ